MEINIDRMIRYYDQLNLKWDIDDMLGINKTDTVINDLFENEFLEVLIVFVSFGLKDHDVKRAIDIVEGWLELFGDVESLKDLIIISLKDVHKFINEKRNDEDLVSVFDKKEPEKEIDHAEQVRIEKSNLEYVIRVYMDCGYRYDEALKMDMSNFEFLEDYILRKRETDLNNFLNIAHRLGAWTGLAVNNPKKYPIEIESIRLREKTREEKIKEIREGTEALYKKLRDKEEQKDG